MLTTKQREQAQRRFVDRLDGIEVATGLSLSAVMADAKTNASKRITKIVKEAQKADDPNTAVMVRLPEIRSVIAQEMGKEEVVASAATVIRSARSAALLQGAQEGTRRVSEATQRPALAVTADRLAAQQKDSLADSEFAAATWTQGTIEKAQAGTVIEAIIVVGTAVDIKQIADVLEKAVTSRAAFGARNEVIGSARDGVMGAFRDNGQQGWVWIAEDDACEFCWGMSGLVFEITEDLESHPNCRCSQEPVEDINDPQAGFDPTDLFRDIGEAQQIAALGKEGYKEFLAGDRSLREFAQERGARISRAQLQRDVARKEIPPKHLAGYEDLPGAAGKLPVQVQDAITEKATFTGRAQEWSNHVANPAAQFGDPYFRELTTGMGVDNGPRVYSAAEIDEFAASGEIELFRGVGEEGFAREFVEGASSPGRGVYGSGYYATDSRVAANGYAGEVGGSTTMRMTISSDARVVDWDEVVSALDPKLANNGDIAAFRANRLEAGKDTLPFVPSPAIKALLRKSDDAVAELEIASARVAKAQSELLFEWELQVGSDDWAKFYDPDKALADQPLLLAVARREFSIPGMRVSRQLRDAAQEFVNANAKYVKANTAAQSASALSATDFSKAVLSEGDALFGSTSPLLSGYDVVRVQRDVSEAYYVVLNRDVLRVSDTAEVYSESAGTFVPKKMFANESDSLENEIASLVDERVSRAEELGKTLDGEMQQIADELGATLDGLEFSVKGRGSMARKIKGKVLKSRSTGSPMTPSEVMANDIRDANRYTMLVNTETYGDDVARFVEELRGRGYTFSNDQWRNTWSKFDDEGNLRAYRGLNVNMETANGDLIEVQFHTRESFAVKQKNHKLYEEQRLAETTDERGAYLAGQMAGNWDAMPDPVRWDKVLTVPGDSFAQGTVKPSKIVDLFVGTRGAKKQAADGVTEVLNELDKFMRLPASRNEGGVIPTWWGGSRFAKKDLKDTVAFYQRLSNRQTKEHVESEMGMSGANITTTMTKREIVEDFASTFAHEFGHAIEGELFGSKRAFATAIDNVDHELYGWYSAISESKMVQNFRENGVRTLKDTFGLSDYRATGYFDYYMSPEELWARSFAQWFARKTGGKVYTEQALRSGKAFKQLADVGIDPHWTGSDFDKIEKAFDDLFRERGWIL